MELGVCVQISIAIYIQLTAVYADALVLWVTLWYNYLHVKRDTLTREEKECSCVQSPVCVCVCVCVCCAIGRRDCTPLCQ